MIVDTYISNREINKAIQILKDALDNYRTEFIVQNIEIYDVIFSAYKHLAHLYLSINVEDSTKYYLTLPLYIINETPE